MNDIRCGIAFKILNLLIYSFISINLKFLADQSVNIFQIIFLSSVVGFLVVNFIPNKNITYKVYKVKVTKLYVCRGLITVSALYCWIKALTLISISQATAISYITPILASLIAILFFKEKMTKNIVYALMLGFIGMLVIIRPSTDMVIYSGLVLALLSAFMWAFHDVIVKQQSVKDHWLYQSHFTFLMNIVFALPFAIYYWNPITSAQILHIILISILFILNKACLIKALSSASLVILSPISFFRLIFTSVMAYLLFQETITIYVVIGSMIIIISTMIILKESKKII